MLTLTKLSETTSTITLGWTPPLNVSSYTFYASGQVASVASKNLKDGTPRNSIKFSKTSPGPPFQVAAVSRSAQGTFALDIGTYPGIGSVVYPSSTLYPSEVSP